MRKNYIIKDARRILAEQIRDNGMNTMNKNPITNATGLSAIIPKDNDGYCTVYKMDCEDGLGLMTVYQVYPGIQLIYNDFEATSCYWDGTIDKNVLEINHCREGREGSVLQSGSCLYLGEGDLSIHTMDNCASEMAFPLRHYRGISVVLDLELVSQNPPRAVLVLQISKTNFVPMAHALSCGPRMRLSISFLNCIPYRIACKSHTSC